MRQPGPYEGEWFAQLAKDAAAQGIAAQPLIRRVATRLVVGADTYGEASYREKDVIREAHDEAADLVAYALLETFLRNETGRGGHHHLMRAALYAVMADHELRLSRVE